MPDINSIIEGFEYIDYPANMGNNWGGLEFPDSFAADYMGGLNTLIFSGKDAYGNRIDPIDLPYEVSGYWGPGSPIIGLTGYIYRPYTAAEGYDGSEYSKGWGRFYTLDFSPRGYSTNTPNLRTYFNIPRQDPPTTSSLPITGTGLNNWDKSITSIQKLNLLDIISEGPIEGLVTGDYIFNLSGKRAGDIGYTSAVFAPYTTNTGTAFGAGALNFFKSSPETRSIFWNDTPISTQRGLLNFQYANYKFTNGEPNIHTISNPYVNLYEDRYHWDGFRTDTNKYPIVSSYTKLIGEQLWGGNYYVSNVSGYASPRRYYVYDTDIQAIRVHLKVNSLYIQNLTGARFGEYDRLTVPIYLKLFRLFADRTEALATVPGWPDNPGVFAADTVQYKGKIQVPTLVSYTFWLRQFKDNGQSIRVLPNQIGWVLDISKLSAEGAGLYTQNSVEVADLQYIYMDRFTYANTAMAYSSFDARYFTSVPERSYHVRLLKVKVPSNYNPITKTYSGVWNGKFKLAWTDNPAWCFYDMITNNRFGLGKYMDSALVDKWTLYEVSQYCDQLVPDGLGGLEPRFTCNLYITTKAEAYKVINDMASIFNGLPYYMAGQIFVSQDRPKEPIYLFNNSNVLNGEFTYQDSSKRNRRSVAIVRYNDENNNYKPAMEYVEDRESILKYGIREVEVAAFGGTRKSQARRLGRWFLSSENLETETVSFNTSIEGSLFRPGDVIRILDQNRQNKIYAGRTLSLTTGSAVLDISHNALTSYLLTGINKTLTFNVLTPSYNLNAGTKIGDEYITGYNVGSDGQTGINHELYRRNQIQNIYINPTKNFISAGTGIYSGNVAINFSSNLKNLSNPFTIKYEGNIEPSGQGFTKRAYTESWLDAHAYSDEGYIENVYSRAIPANHYQNYAMFGLNTDPRSFNWNTIDYAWYFVSGGGLQIRAGGSSALSGITWTNYNRNTTYQVDYDGSNINFWSGNNLVYKALRTGDGGGLVPKGQRYYFDSALYNQNAGFSFVDFGTYGLDQNDYKLLQNTVWTLDISTSGDYGEGLSGIYNRFPNEFVQGNVLYDGWYLEPYLDKTKLYRVVNITEKENNTFNINALEYNPAKYYDIDTGLALVSVKEKNPTPDKPLAGLHILYRDERGNYTGAAGSVYTTYQTRGLNSIAYLITGASGPNGSGIVSSYRVYFSSGLQTSNSSFTPPESDLITIFQGKEIPSTVNNATTRPPFVTPIATGDYYLTVYAENDSKEISAAGTAQIKLAQQTIPAVVIASGINIL